jgi:hypothetical protein
MVLLGDTDVSIVWVRIRPYLVRRRKKEGSVAQSRVTCVMSLLHVSKMRDQRICRSV